MVATLGEFRRATARLSDDTPLQLFAPIGGWSETLVPARIEPWPEVGKPQLLIGGRDYVIHRQPHQRAREVIRRKTQAPIVAGSLD